MHVVLSGMLSWHFCIPRPPKLGRGLCRQMSDRLSGGGVFDIAHTHPLGSVDVPFGIYTKCAVSGKGMPWKKSTRFNFKWLIFSYISFYYA